MTQHYDIQHRGHWYRVELDLDKLGDLLDRAGSSVVGKARALGGAIVAKGDTHLRPAEIKRMRAACREAQETLRAERNIGGAYYRLRIRPNAFGAIFWNVDDVTGQFEWDTTIDAAVIVRAITDVVGVVPTSPARCSTADEP